MSNETVTIETADGEAVEVPASMVNDYQRAVSTHEGVEHLSKSEAVYYLDSTLRGETPEGSPSDHNGNVTRAQVTAWARIVADYANRNGVEAIETARGNVEESEESDDGDESDESDE